MAVTDPNAALRAEMVAAEAVLAPEINGLTALTNVAISIELVNQINLQITICNRRKQLIQGVINALDAVVAALTALYADGYPSLATITLNTALLAELKTELANVEAAVGVLETSIATSIAGDPTTILSVGQPRT